MSASRLVSATPPPSTPPKASPPTPCTASLPGRSPGGSCTPCSPEDGTPTTSTSKWSATATPTPSSAPTPSHPARRPRRCSRSSAAMKRRSPPAPCCASSTIRRPGSSRRSSATPTASTSQPSSSSELRPSRSSTKPISTSPGLTTEPAWPTLRAHLLDLAAETGKHPLRHMLTAAAARDLRTAGDMAAVLYWRLPELAPTKPGPLPWLPGIPETLRSHPGWRPYLTKRCLLVADLADQIQDHACQGDAEPIWTLPGSHPSTALVGEIAVWRAANGINPRVSSLVENWASFALGVYQINGGSDLVGDHLVGMRPGNVIANAFRAGFHLVAHRALPRPVGSSDRVVR